MGRVLSGIVLAVLMLVVATGCTEGLFGASPSQAVDPASARGATSAGTSTIAGRAPAGRTVSVAPVSVGRVKIAFTYSGMVQSRSQVNLAPKGTGRLEQVLVEAGSEVQAGDVIAVLERGTLQLGIQQAEANLRAAQAKLGAMAAGGRPEEVTSAEAVLAAASARLSQLRSGPTASDLQTTQSDTDAARANLASAQARLELVKAGPTQADWASALAAVDVARAGLRSAEARLAQLKGGPTGAEVQAAQAAVAEARSGLMRSQDIYETAKSDLAEAMRRTDNRVSSVSQAAQMVDSAQTLYEASVQKLSLLQSGPLAADLQAAQSNVDAAKAILDGALAKVDQLKNSPMPQEVAQAQSTVDAARALLAAAEAKQTELQQGARADELAAAEAAVTQAQQSVALKRHPYTAHDLQGAQAAVDVAGTALALAQVALTDATVTAPFAGTITQRLLSPGAMASSGTPIVTLASPEAEAIFTVEESHLARLRSGLEAPLTTPFYPGETFPGKITSLAPAMSLDGKSRVFVMKVVPEDSEGKLKAGMSTEIKLTAEERDGALLVPRESVVRRAGKDVLFVVVEGRAQMREVALGIPDDNSLEVISGVRSGEQVIVNGQIGLNDGDPVRIGPPTSG